jgi:hypothetical protein
MKRISARLCLFLARLFLDGPLSLLRIPSEQKSVVPMSDWNPRAVMKTPNFEVGLGEKGAMGNLSQTWTE